MVGGEQSNLEILHKKIFEVQMKEGHNNDLFKLKSPYLQEFIENNLHGQGDDAVQNLQKKLQASTKHFLKIHQPVSLFNYMEE